MTTTSPSTLGDCWMIVREPKKLKNYLAYKEISARQLAKAAGWTSHSYMNRILSGEARNITPESGARIAKYLDVPVEQFFSIEVSNELGRTEPLKTQQTRRAPAKATTKSR